MKKYTNILLSLMVLTLVMLPAMALADTSTAEPVLPDPTPTVDPSDGPSLDPTPSPTPQPTSAPSGKDYKVEYKGGNTFSTNNSAVPTSVEIDGVPVSFTGDGNSFTVSCIRPASSRITVRWNSTSITVSFKPDANITCTSVNPPKTGDASALITAMGILAMAGVVAKAGRKSR